MAENAVFATLAVTTDNNVLCKGQRLRLTPYEEVVLGELIRAQAARPTGLSQYAALEAAAVARGFSSGAATSNVLQAIVWRLRKILQAANAGVRIQAYRSRGYALVAEQAP